LIGDKFKSNGKEYEIKKDITFGEHRRISKLSNIMDKLQVEYKNATIEEQLELKIKINSVDEEQTTDMVNLFSSALGLSQEDLEKLDYNEAYPLFAELWLLLTQVKKKSEITSE